MKLVDYMGIIAGVLIIPQIAKITFGIEISDSTVKVILLFIIFYGVVELLKDSK